MPKIAPFVAPSQNYPTVRGYPVYTSGTAFSAGDLVLYDTTNNGLVRCGADPALIAGIAHQSSANASLYVPNGLVPVSILDASTPVVMALASGTPSDTLIGDAYGIARNADGFWEVDTSDTVATRVTIIDVFPSRATSGADPRSFGQTWVVVNFLAANLQFDN